jgi:hypothetical protein
MGRARQYHAELGRNDMGDALLGIAEIEDADAVAAAPFAHRPQERRAVGVRGVVAPGLGRDGVVLHREGQIGAPDAAVGLGELLEGMRAVQLMEHVPIDVDEVAPIGAARDEMGVPDLVEQGLRHERGPAWRAGRTPTPERLQVKFRFGPYPPRSAFDESKYPDWSGQWTRPRGLATQWDQAKPAGLGQQAPLIPEYQKRLEASIADQAAGGQGLDTRYKCMTNGMPRVMAAIFPLEFVILPNLTYVNFEAFMPRRIYTDGRDFPTDEEPSFMGYSIGKWLDTDNDGRYDTLEVETRNFKGPRTVEFSGIPLHDDNETVVKERIFLDPANPEVMHNVITIIDHAFSSPWTVDKRYRRIHKVIWFEDNCNENNHHIVIGDQNYFVSGDGYLMPTRKDQAAPDLRYFKNAAGK